MTKASHLGMDSVNEERFSRCVRELCSEYELLFRRYREACAEHSKPCKRCGEVLRTNNDILSSTEIEDVPDIPRISPTEIGDFDDVMKGPTRISGKSGSETAVKKVASHTLAIPEPSHEHSRSRASNDTKASTAPHHSHRSSFFMHRPVEDQRAHGIADVHHQPRPPNSRQPRGSLIEVKPHPNGGDLPGSVQDQTYDIQQSVPTSHHQEHVHHDHPGDSKDHTTKTRQLRQQLEPIWDFFDKPSVSAPRKVYHQFLKIMIVASVISPIISTTSLSDSTKVDLARIDLFFTLYFTCETVVKFISCPTKWSFLKNVYTLNNVVVLVAGYVSFAFVYDIESRWRKVGNQLLILRLLEITRHSDGWPLLLLALKRCVGALRIPLYLMLLIVVFSGTLHYWIDQGLGCSQDQHCDKNLSPAFDSIPHAMWYVIVTVSTVGYGDVVPHTYLGKILATVQILLGVCYMAMPLSIIGSNFSQVWEDRHRLLVRSRLMERLQYISLEEVKTLFDSIDSDDDGALQLTEFNMFITNLKLDLSKRDSIDLFRAIDIDMSDCINFEEFVDFVLLEGQEFNDSANRFRQSGGS